MQPVENAVIAVAGLGSRLGLGHPKCMLEIEGVTLLTRMIRLLEPCISNIHLVVGYREDMILEHCARNHPKITIVRNPEYRTTNTAQSLSLGSQYLKGKCIYLDGDLILHPSSLRDFLKKSAQSDILLGICPHSSEQAVFVKTEERDKELLVNDFSRDELASFEWANVFSGPSNLMLTAENYVFEHLAQYLPLPSHILEIAEVDTISDMKAAELFVAKHSL